jgi:OmpA-OmpF porin, OOP family
LKNQIVYIIGTSVLTLLISCSHNIKPATLATDSPEDEISSQDSMMDQAYNAQIDVLSPDHFEEALDYLNDAKKGNKDGSKAKEVLEDVAYSRAHLNKANEKAGLARAQAAQIIAARQLALTAGARKYPYRLNKIDRKLKEYTDDKEILITLKEREELQDEYSALELHSILEDKLGEAKELLKKAKKKDAEEITPTTFALAQEKYTVAERTIQNNRHSTEEIDSTSQDATVSAKRVMSLLASEKVSRNLSPEQRALNLEAKNKRLKSSRSEKAELMERSLEKDQRLSAQGAILADSQEENEDYKARELDEAAVREAAAKFDTNEADVYRQDGVLIIRLKSMNFASSRSDLPANSIAVLAKVKDVIKGFGDGKVVVQGHTDATGAEKTNQKLSEQRAQSVKMYLNADTSLSNNDIESIGYGFSKPLGTNKTAKGRSQNRRVDILIEPKHSI